MSETVPVLKDEHNQRPVPSAWRSTFSAIVEALKEEDFSLARRVVGVRQISAENAARIAGNIKSYGTSLPEEAWKTSACQWMRGY